MRSLRLLCSVIVMTQSAVLATADELPVVGYVEKVLLTPGDVVAYALLSSTAAESKIFCPRIETFEREGRKWVRYTVETRFGQKTTFENPVVKSRLADDKVSSDKRIIYIRKQFCLGSTVLEGEFELIESATYSEQLMVGRDILAGHVLLDPKSSYTVEPKCS